MPKHRNITLKWSDTEPIAKILYKSHPHEDIDDMDLDHLLDLVVEIDEFEGDHIFAKNEKHLRDILNHWKTMKEEE